MRHGSRHFIKIGAAIAALITAMISGVIAGPALVAAAPANTVDVDISVTNLRNTQGVVMACMTNDPDRFPRCRDDAHSYRVTVAASATMTLHFADVLPGTYAIALLHDENENGRADRALTMIPREGFGFSRDAAVRLGPPDFDDAAFVVGNRPLRQSIRMRYIL